MDSVWPLVKKANKEIVTYRHISRNLTTLSNPGKPFLCARKGTIQRAITVKLYKDVIEKLYKNFGTAENTKDFVELDLSSEEALARSIVDTLRKYIRAEKLEEDGDFFAAGVNSMGIIRASKLLRAGLKNAGRKVDNKAVAARVIYQNATPRQLTVHILGNVLTRQGQALSKDEQ